jgi:hypothetical protein
MFGHRSLYHDGWRAVCPWPGRSFVESGRALGDAISYSELIQLDATSWELYNLTEDCAETNNLADQERERLIAMIGMWYVEAGKYNVLPIDARGTARFAIERPRTRTTRRPRGGWGERAPARHAHDSAGLIEVKPAGVVPAQ